VLGEIFEKRFVFTLLFSNKHLQNSNLFLCLSANSFFSIPAAFPLSVGPAITVNLGAGAESPIL